MAETSVLEQTEQAPPLPKQPVGRPRKDGLPAGTQVPPIRGLNEDDFFLSLANFEPKQWDSLSVYVYRLKPITDRQSKGEPKYLCKYGQAIDVDQLMRDYGSGYYQLRLIQTGVGPKSGHEVARTHIDIVNLDYPPKLAVGDWIDDARNRDWLWCRDKLVPSPSSPGSTTPGQLVEAMVKMQQANQPRQDMTVLTALAPLLDPQRQTEMMMAFANLLPKPLPPAEPKEDKSLAMLFTMIQEQLKDAREEVREMRRQAAAEKAAQPAQSKSWLELALEQEDLMRRIFGRGNSGPQLDGWTAVIDKAVDKLGPAVGTVGTLLAQRLMMPTPQPAPHGQTITVQPQPQPTLPAPAAQPVPQQQQEQKQEAPAQLDALQKYGNVIQQALPFMIDKFKEEEPDGYDCRDWFCSPKRFGNVIWEGLRTDIGVEQFVTIAKSIPQVWAAFQPEEKFRMFLTDFFTPVGQERPEYFDEDEEPEDEPDAK
jgi:hypothetical protein